MQDLTFEDHYVWKNMKEPYGSSEKAGNQPLPCEFLGTRFPCWSPLKREKGPVVESREEQVGVFGFLMDGSHAKMTEFCREKWVVCENIFVETWDVEFEEIRPRQLLILPHSWIIHSILHGNRVNSMFTIRFLDANPTL